jgi:hypothetical protein
MNNKIDEIITHAKKENNIVDYYSHLCEKVTKNLHFEKNLEKNLEKTENENIHIPNFDESNYLYRYKYNLTQLKTIAKSHKLRIAGNKSELISRIYSFLFLSKLSVKIQKIIRGYLERKYISLRGPAFKKRLLCTNTFDFLSMDQLTDIPNKQFFSFKDDDGFLYGFDLLSLYNLIYKSNGPVKNPFNNQALTSKVIENFRSFLRLSRILKINICTELSDITKEVSDKKSVELRCLTLFQNIDALGNYSNAQWFLALNRNQLIKFTRELVDIWCYRAPLTIETKREICPPNGNPFLRMPNFYILQTLENIDDVRKIILDILEKFVETGVDKDSKCLGAYYVLGALTLANNDAALALPWLYQAVCYM